MKYYYTYLVKCKPINKFYYGVRSSNTPPENDLWQKYFTSSKIIKELILKYGKDAFDYEIRKTFTDLEQSLKWEKNVLLRLDIFNNQDKWLNRNIAGVILSNDEMRKLQSERMKNNNPSRNIAPETRKKLSASKMGAKNPRFGYKYTDEEKQKKSIQMKGRQLSEEHITKLREKALGRSHTDETKQKLSVMAKNRLSNTLKIWTIKNPQNEIIIVNNLPKFAQEHNIDKNKLRYTLKTNKPYNGFICLNKH